MGVEVSCSVALLGTQPQNTQQNCGGWIAAYPHVFYAVSQS